MRLGCQHVDLTIGLRQCYRIKLTPTGVSFEVHNENQFLASLLVDNNLRGNCHQERWQVMQIAQNKGECQIVFPKKHRNCIVKIRPIVDTSLYSGKHHDQYEKTKIELLV